MPTNNKPAKTRIIEINPATDLQIPLDDLERPNDESGKLFQLKIELIRNIIKTKKTSQLEAGIHDVIDPETKIITQQVHLTHPLKIVDSFNESIRSRKVLTQFLNAHKKHKLLFKDQPHTSDSLETNVIYTIAQGKQTSYYFLRNPIYKRLRQSSDQNKKQNNNAKRYHGVKSRTLGTGVFGSASIVKRLVEEKDKLYDNKDSKHGQEVLKLTNTPTFDNDPSSPLDKELINEQTISNEYTDGLTKPIAIAESSLKGAASRKTFLTTRLEKGIALSALLELIKQRQLSFSYNELLGLAQKIIFSVQKLHQLGFVHLDIKPENIMVDFVGDTFNVALIDFGLSEKIGVESEPKGTPMYLDPNCLSNPITNINADVFSTGITLGELFGAKPDQDLGNEDTDYTVRFMQFIERTKDASFDSLHLPPALQKYTTTLQSMTKLDPDARIDLLQASKAIGELQASITSLEPINESAPDPLQLATEVNRQLKNIAVYSKHIATKKFLSQMETAPAICEILKKAIALLPDDPQEIKTFLLALDINEFKQFANQIHFTSPLEKNDILDYLERVSDAYQDAKERVAIAEQKYKILSQYVIHSPDTLDRLEENRKIIHATDKKLKKQISMFSEIPKTLDQVDHDLSHITQIQTNLTNMDKLNAIAGVQAYLKLNQTFTYKLTHFFSSAGTNRAKNYLTMLEASKNEYEIDYILLTMLGDQRGGTNLRKIVAKSLNFSDAPEAELKLRSRNQSSIRTETQKAILLLANNKKLATAKDVEKILASCKEAASPAPVKK